jgi:tetratricopeptide (TPR) repeat protein
LGGIATENVKLQGKPPEVFQIPTVKPKPPSSSKSESQQTLTSIAISEIQELKSEANQLFRDGRIEDALDLYSYLLEFILGNCEDEVDNHEIAVIYGNKAECLLKMGRFEEAFDAAIESVGFDGHWFKVMYLPALPRLLDNSLVIIF